jgi:quinoprotein glucose dehydrogenase
LQIAEAALGRAAIITVIALAMPGLPAAHSQAIPGASPESVKQMSQGEWPAYGGTYAAARYSPLTRIDRDNAKDLHVVWRSGHGDQASRSQDWTNPRQ